MKILLQISLVLLLALNACKQNPDEKKTDSKNSFSSVLPSSTGAADEIMVIVDDASINDSLSKVINRSVNEIYRVLPKEEYLFTISVVPYSSVNQLMYRFRNIILVSNTSNTTEILATAKSLLSNTDFEKLKNGSQKTFTVNNVWSHPQNVVFVFGNSEKDIENTFKQDGNLINRLIKTADLDAYRKIAYLNGVNMKLKEQWQDYHKIAFDVPTDYKLAKNDENFVLLRKEIEKGMIFLEFDVVHYSDSIPDANYGTQFFNERGKYISSNAEKTFVKTEELAPTLSQKILKSHEIIYENSGMWKMENDFMGGSYINRYIIDNANKRVIFVNGLVFAPGENNKKKYMRQIEAIFSTLKVE